MAKLREEERWTYAWLDQQYHKQIHEEEMEKKKVYFELHTDDGRWMT